MTNVQVTIPAGQQSVVVNGLAAGNYAIQVSAAGFIPATGTATLAEGESVSLSYSLGAVDPRTVSDNIISYLLSSLASLLELSGPPFYALPTPFINQVIDSYERLANGEKLTEAFGNEIADIIIEGADMVADVASPAADAVGEVAETVGERLAEEVWDDLTGDEEGGSFAPLLIVLLVFAALMMMMGE